MCDLDETLENLEGLPQVCSNCKRKALKIIKDAIVEPQPELCELLELYLQKKHPTYADYAREENIVGFVHENGFDAHDSGVVVSAFGNFFKALDGQNAIIPPALLDFFKSYEVVWLTKEFAILKGNKIDFRVYADVLSEWLQGKAKIRHALQEDVADIYNPSSGIFEKRAEALLNVLLATTAPNCASGAREEIIKAVKAQNAVASFDELEKAPPHFIPCKNGVLDLRNFKLKPYAPEYGFTAKLPVPYNPDAKCQKIDTFINEICSESKDAEPDSKMVRGLKQLAAYCLWPSYPIQKLFFLIGAGANGKGIFCSILQALLGAENVSNTTITKLCYDRFAPADLEGKFANIANEMTVSEVKNFDAIKSMTSGTDRIRIERKGVQGYTIAPFAKIITASNKPPKSPDASDGFFRRLILFFFQRQFYGGAAKIGLEQELTTESELSGFLNEALAELRLWLDDEGNFLPQAAFVNDLPVDEIRELYERASDTVAAFEYDSCSFTGNVEDEISKDALYSAYMAYCKEKKLPPIGGLQFKREFSDRNMGKLQESQPRKGNKRERVYIGLSITSKSGTDGTRIFNSIQEILTTTSLTRESKKNVFHVCQNDENSSNQSYLTIKQPVPSVPDASDMKKSVPPVPVLFLKESQDWVGSDKKIYGAFQAGQVAELPQTEAEFVIKSGLAQPVNGGGTQ